MLKDYCNCLAIEVSERANLSGMLSACSTYHLQEMGPVKEAVKVRTALGPL